MTVLPWFPTSGLHRELTTPSFPALHQSRNQYFTVQDRRTFGDDWINELRFGINRTTASTSIDNTHPGLSTSLVPGRPFGMIDVTGVIIWQLPGLSSRRFSTVYQVQDQLSRTIGCHTLKFGVEVRRLQTMGRSISVLMDCIPLRI